MSQTKKRLITNSVLGIPDSLEIHPDLQTELKEQIKNVTEIIRNQDLMIQAALADALKGKPKDFTPSKSFITKVIKMSGLQPIIEIDHSEAIDLCRQIIKTVRDVSELTDPQQLYDNIKKEFQVRKTENPIDVEFKLRNLKLHKQQHRGEFTPKFLSTGTDPTFTWDSMFRKDHQPVYKPLTYVREIDGQKIFIPNVRVVMDPNLVDEYGNPTKFEDRFKKPLAAHPRWYPEENYEEIDIPVYEQLPFGEYPHTETELTLLKCTKIIVEDVSEVTVKWARSETTREMVKVVYTHNSISKGKKKSKYVRRVTGSKTIKYMKTGGIPFKGSKEIGPPCIIDESLDSSGQVVRKLSHWWCYADGMADGGKAYTILGSWASEMRKRFLKDLADGNVNICIATEFRNNERIVKHQAFKAIHTHVPYPDGHKEAQYILMFCDIQPIGKSQFASQADVNRLFASDV